MNGLPRIDVSIGDAALPFNAAARYGYESAAAVINQYDNYGEYSRERAYTVQKFLNDEAGIKRPGYTGVGNDCFTFTNGTTGGYALAIEALAEEALEYNKFAKQKRKPVVIMPVPTYGLFFPHLREHGIEIVTIDREPNGSVDPVKLHNLMVRLHKGRRKKIIAYYDSNPNNPTGYVRGMEETKALADVFLRHNGYLRYIKDKIRNRVGSRACWELHYISNEIKVIDDMVYMGTEFGAEKATPFMAIKEMFPHTFMLAGGSKIGLAALRTGVLIADQKYTDRFREKSSKLQYFASPVATNALEVVFPNTDEHKLARQTHLDEMNAYHRFSGLLMKAMINGIDDVDVTEGEHQRMREIIMTVRHVDAKEAEQMLADGVKGVTVTTSPQSGFFHLLDFSELKGRLYHNPKNWDSTSTEKIKDEWALDSLQRTANIKFCSGTFTGLPIDKMIVRTTFAIPPEQVVEVIDRIEVILGEVTPCPLRRAPVHSLQCV